MLFGKQIFLPISMQIHNQKIASYEVSCKIEFQFLALRNPLSKIFLNKISAKCCLVVCANTLLLLEHYLTP